MEGVLCVLVDYFGPLNLSKSIFPRSRMSISQLMGLIVQAWCPAAFVVCLSHSRWFNNPSEPGENRFKKNNHPKIFQMAAMEPEREAGQILQFSIESSL